MPTRPSLNPLILTVAFVACACAIAGSAFLRAASPRPATQAETSTIANVDMQRVYAESEMRVQAERKLREYNQKMTQRFDEVAKLQFVTFDEINDYNIAINAANPTEAQTKRIAAVKAASDSRTAEYQKLNTKPEAALTAQDRARIRELNTMQQQRPSVLAQVQRLYQDDLTQQELKLNREGIAEVRAAVQKMAKELNFTQVFDISALVYAPNDITDAALRKVRAKGK